MEAGCSTLVLNETAAKTDVCIPSIFLFKHTSVYRVWLVASCL